MGFRPSLSLKKEFNCFKDIKNIESIDIYAFLFSKDKLDKSELNRCLVQKLGNHPFSIEIDGLVIPLNKKQFKKYEKFKTDFKKVFENKRYKFNRTLIYLNQKNTSDSDKYLLLEEFKKYKGLYPRILEAYAYLKFKMPEKSQSILRATLDNEFQSYLLNQNLLNLRLKSDINTIIKVLAEIESQIKDPIIKDFLLFLESNSIGTFRDHLNDEITVRFSSSQIKRKLKSSFELSKYANLWGPLIYDKLSREQYSLFMKRSLLSSTLVSRNQNLIFYRGLPSISRNDKLKVIDAFEKLLNDKNFYQRELVIRLLSDASFFKFIKANYKKKIKPLFLLKRELYLDMLENYVTPEYSIFQMFALGDYSEDYLLKSMAIMSYDF